MKKIIQSLLVLLLIASTALAQDRTISGTVTAKGDGLPIPGVSVKIKGTNVATQTGADGKFSLKLPTNSKSLVISYIGFLSQDLPISSRNSYDVSLITDSKQLSEVIVTAFGLERKRNQVAYAAQQVSGAEVSDNRSTNVLGSLSGKISGLEIKQNNALGASTNVILRGVKSITGNNQALFVVDGVPVDNSNTNRGGQSQGGGGYDYGSPASDINPDNIESVTVLKGAAASALYGSRGSNGVILITTKKGTSGLGITVNTGLSVGMLDKSTFVTYQHEYGGGYGAYYENRDVPKGSANYRRFFYRDINSDGKKDYVFPSSEDASYGARFDPSLLVYQWDAFEKTSPNFKKPTPWVAAANDPTTFFESPVSNNQNILLTGGGDNGTFKLGFDRSNDQGILPNSKLNKNIINFGGTYKVTKQLTAGANVNYYNINGSGRGGTGYDGASGRNVLTNFREWWQVNTDIKGQKDAYYRTGRKNATWNYADPTDLTPIYWDNPYFVRFTNVETDTRNRYLGNVSLNYKPLDWLNITGRVSLDSYATLQQERKSVGSVGVPYFSRFNQSVSETNYDLLANIDKNISEDFNLKALLGTNIRKQTNNSVSAVTNGGLIVEGIYALSNSVNTPNAPVEFEGKREVDGVFAGATLSYKTYLTLDGTIRRDASSTLPKGNNVYYYPSISLGFVFSELLKNQSWLSYGKLRANYAQVGSDAGYYNITDTYSITAPFGPAAQFAVRDTKNNPNLKPERTGSYEVGLEMSFLKNRIGFDATYFKTNTVNQILAVPLSTATGYSFKYLNSGTVENKGFEVSMNGIPLRTKDFSWKINANWSRLRSKVTELFKDDTGQQAQNLQLASFQGGITANAALGQPFGILRGTDFIYDNQGRKVIDASGFYEKTGTSNNNIGNPNANWIGGINNSFTYKNLSLSFLVDVRHGGDVFSTDLYYGLATGLYPETAGLNELGNPSRDPVSAGGGILNKGVTEDGKPNTVRISNSNYGNLGYSINPDKAFIYDASYVKLREAVLNYSLPKSFIAKLNPVKAVDVSLVGRNLWIIHKNLPYSDPEEGLSSGNIQGYQVGAQPTTRTIGFNLKFKF
ncbi:MAG: SusC/RagA family TonB-linked outer membrane protein [Pedobacter sp.]|nr:SusC/RagA family TonB-linked outer membrane protein [Pedobacter sp.]